MPKNEVNDLITDQEMAFARLVLSGTMTDRDAAQTAGLNPETAAYTKAKPRVRAYMLEHRAAVQQKLVEQEAERIRQQNVGRERVLRRLWEIASMSPEMTRSSITGQVKAIAMIVAIEGLIPDRRAASAENKPTPPPNIYQSEWIRRQREQANHPQPSPAADQEEHQTEVAKPEPAHASAPVSAADPSPAPVPAFGSGVSNFASRVSPAETAPWLPDTRF